MYSYKLPPSAVNFTPTIYHTVLYREECNKSATRKQKSKNNQPVEKVNCPKIYGQQKKSLQVKILKTKQGIVIAFRVVSVPCFTLNMFVWNMERSP